MSCKILEYRKSGIKKIFSGKDIGKGGEIDVLEKDSYKKL